jgi:hypothetical protein
MKYLKCGGPDGLCILFMPVGKYKKKNKGHENKY